MFFHCFTVYVLIVGRSGDLFKADLWKQILSTVLVTGIAAYGWIQFWEEINQLKNSVADSRELIQFDLLGLSGAVGLVAGVVVGHFLLLQFQMESPGLAVQFPYVSLHFHVPLH